jgi:hypothetical protein
MEFETIKLHKNFKKFIENCGTFFGVPVSIFTRVKTLGKEMVQYEGSKMKC